MKNLRKIPEKFGVNDMAIIDRSLRVVIIVAHKQLSAVR